MATPDFDSTYGDNPWAGITDKTRMIYIPDLLDVYRKRTFYQQFIPFKVDLLQSHAQFMTFTSLYELEPNTDPIGLRQMWIDGMATDSEQKSITMEHHGGKVSLHQFDEYIMQWRKNGLSGLRGIIRNHLATAMSRHLDFLAMAAYFQGSWQMYGKQWDKANFAGLDAANGADDFDPGISDEIYLGMQTRDQHGAIDVVGTGTPQIVALATPGILYAIQKNDKWIAAHQYANPQALLRYEVGSYRNVRYLSNSDQILWNAGAITAQLPVIEPILSRSGAARYVDANRVVGQEALEEGVKRYIQFDVGADLSDFAVNDYVTIHRTRTNVYGVTNGVNPFSGANTHRRIVSVDNDAKRIAFERPILKQDYTTDMGGSVYAYVTKATSIHPVIFLTGPNAVVAGVTQSPRPHTPLPVDDFEAFYRVSWDAYLKYQIWNDHAVEISYHTAPYRIKGLRRY